MATSSSDRTPDRPGGTDQTREEARPQTVRTTFEGVMLSLPEEGLVSGGTQVILSPRLQTFLEYTWRCQPLPVVADGSREAVRDVLIDELMTVYGLDRQMAEALADARLFFNR